MDMPIGNGTTDPPTGIIADILDGTSETITAIPSAGWGFAGWLADGQFGGTTNPLTFPMSADHTFIAVFYELPPPHGPAITYDIFDSSKWSMIGHTKSNNAMTLSSDFSILLAGIGL